MVAGGDRDEFDAGSVVGHDAVYFHRFGGVLNGNHPQAGLGGEAFDFNTVAHNLAYVARLKNITAFRVFHVLVLGYIRGFFNVAVDYYFNERCKVLHRFQRVELKRDRVLFRVKNFFDRMKKAADMDVNREPSCVYGKAVAQLVHHFLEEMVDGLDRLVVAAVISAPIPHGRAYRVNINGLFLCVYSQVGVLASCKMIWIELRFNLVHLLFGFID